jgi:hypothetical protein
MYRRYRMLLDRYFPRQAVSIESQFEIDGDMVVNVIVTGVAHTVIFQKNGEVIVL